MKQISILALILLFTISNISLAHEKYSNTLDIKGLRSDKLLKDAEELSIYKNENGRLEIIEQLQKHCNKTPCMSDMLIEVEVIIDANCNIIYVKPTNIKSGYQYKVCLESCLNAINKSSRLNLEKKSCKKYAHEAIHLVFMNA